MTELRVYLPLGKLQAQFAAWLSSPTRARAYPPFKGQYSLMVEVAPALAIHRIADLALKAAPEMEPGLLYTERQFGLLELHADAMDTLHAAGQAILQGIGACAQNQCVPQILYHDILENLSDQHALILNRLREGSLLLPGTALLILEVKPALFACAAANVAEKAVPDVVLNDVQMIGATGRVFLSGTPKKLALARGAMIDLLEGIQGRK